MGFRTPQQLKRPSSQQATGRASFRNTSSAQIGGEFLNTAASISKQRLAAEEKARKDREDFLSAVFDNKVETLKVEAQSKLSSVKGANVYEEMPSIKKDYLDGVRSAVDELPQAYRSSPDIQKRIVKKTGDLERFSIGYSYDQTRKLEDEVYNTKVANDINNLAENASDLEYLSNEGVQTLEESIRKKANRKYGNDPRGKMLADYETKVGVSQGLKQAIKMQVASNNFGLAEETIRQNWERITPDDKVELEKVIKSGKEDSSDDLALSIAEESFAVTNGSMEAAEKYARAMSGGDAKIYAKALTFINTKNNIKEKAKKKADEDNYNRLYDQYVKTGSFDRSSYLALPPEDRNKLIKTLQDNGGVEPVVSKPGLLNETISKMSVLPDEELSKMNVRQQYQHSLNSQDIGTIEKMVDHARKRIQGEYSAAQKIDNQVIKRVTNMFDERLELGKNTNRRHEDFTNNVSQRYIEIIEQNPKMTKIEMEKKLIREVNSNIKEKEGLFRNREVVEDLSNQIDPETYRKVNAARELMGKRPFTDQEMIDYLRSRGRLR